MERSVEEIGAKMDALGLWDALAPYNWAVKPHGTAFPYFCTVIKGGEAAVKVRFLMLEGWNTLHDFVRMRADRAFGVVSSPIELPHYELVVLAAGDTKLFRHDPGYMPQEAIGPGRDIAAKILWEAYGVMLRVESDPKLPMRFADEKSVFARVEDKSGAWRDEPLVIPDPPPYVERISFRTDDVKKAKDLPIVSTDVLDVDFRLVPGVMTRDARPRCVYELVAVDPVTRTRVVGARTSIVPEAGLKAMWESMPQQLLSQFLARGRVPGRIRVTSRRVFRFIRPLGMELPFRLSLHESLPDLA